MFGINYIKAQPNTFFMQYKKGKVVREGSGISFFYFAPASSLVAVPMASVDIPFVFNEVTADFQDLCVQGDVTYRISEPKKLAGLLNFTLSPKTNQYESEDPEKLSKKVVNQIQVLMRSQIQMLSLKQALKASENLVDTIRKRLDQSEIICQLGLEILSLSVLSVRPNPETSKALEADIRERLLLEADEAIYNRRNAAVEQERAIKENELNTDIAVENKKRQIREAKIDADRALQEKQQLMKQDEVKSKILIENEKRELVALAAENKKDEADAQAYGLNAVMKAYKQVDPAMMQALANMRMDPAQLIATAFQGFANNAGKIGNLNISPELLQQLTAVNTGQSM